jgi:hypothetical protein
MPRFFFDVVDGAEVSEDPNGLEYSDLEAALREAHQGARDLVAHGIMRNEDVSRQSFRIRAGDGSTVAILSFREALPGRLSN